MSEPMNTSKTARSTKNLKILVVVLSIALVGSIAGGAYAYAQYDNLKKNPASAQQDADEQAKELKNKVSKLISVPADETPVVATVTDKTQLKDQPFFVDAENGDYILMFPQAKKAYIYRENENKLINVGPIAISSDGAAGTSTDKKQ